MNTIAFIPFDGFYQSRHDAALDHMLEIEAEEGNFDFDDDYQNIDFATAHQNYAKEYAELVINELEIDAKFESLDSPQFYNYSSDRVFIELTESQTKDLINKVLNDQENREFFSELLKDRFTSCDGFISSYSNNIIDWIAKLQNNKELDHNELGIILQVAFYDVDFNELQDDFVEDYKMNSCGYLDYLKTTEVQ